MPKFGVCAIFALLTINVHRSTSGSRIQDEIYVNLGAIHHCFRLMNGTHETGCQSPMDGLSGVVHLVSNHSDANYVIDDPDGRSPFIVALPLQAFRDLALVEKLQKSEKVAGLMILHFATGQYSIPTNFSEDSTCPNEFSSLYNEATSACHKWNPDGTSLRHVDWQIPAFYIHNETEIEFIVKFCFEKHNQRQKNWPLCAAELSTFFSAAQSTETCMRRNSLFAGLHENENTCDPVQDVNLFAFVPHTNKSNPLQTHSVVVLAARMDSHSLFYGADFGAASSLANVVTVLAVAEAIGRSAITAPSSVQNDRRLLIALFNGESLDYIGSSRMLWDMANDRFPEPLENSTVNQSALFYTHNINFLLELNQLVPQDPQDSAYYLHVDPKSYKKFPAVKLQVDLASAKLAEFSDGMIKAPNGSTLLPPCSIQSFLKLNRELPALLLTNHGPEKFNNPYYNSFMDTLPRDAGSMGRLVRTLTRLADATTAFLHQRLFNSTEGVGKVDEKIVRRLAECFFDFPKWNCTIFKRIFGSFLKARKDEKNTPEESVDSTIGRTYLSVNSSVVRFYSSYLLSLFLGSKIDWLGKAPDICKADFFNNVTTNGIFSYTYMENLLNDSNVLAGNYCVVSTVRTSVARSPAFDLPSYKFADPHGDPSGVYSTWTESRWNKVWLRLFLKPHFTWELAIFIVGLAYFTLSLVIGYFISKTTHILFTGPATAL